MPDYTPFVATARPDRPKVILERTLDMLFDRGIRHYAWGVQGSVGIWQDAPGRRRLYVCSARVTHQCYWRQQQRGGNSPVELRCEEHEIDFVNATPKLPIRDLRTRR
jgi:hypothetical protein